MVYQYTKPRGPIAAMYSSPGPCYQLPGLVGQPRHDPRSVHNKGPAYPFGMRHGKWRDDCSPGPAYLPQTKIYKDGKDGTPHYSLYSRNQDLSRLKTPGPGAYSPEASGQNAYFRHPAYSFGARNKNRRTDNTPGPNAYSADPMMGRTIRSGKPAAAGYTMRLKTTNGAFYEDLAKAPGPGAYNSAFPDGYNNRNKAPAYSLTSRNTMPGDGCQKPGPGQHSPEKVHVHKRIAPRFSFGIRHSQYKCPMIVDPVD